VGQARFCYDADSVEYLYREGKAIRVSNWNK